eukprot:969686-Pelagomonas_calceolata.AAC.2
MQPNGVLDLTAILGVWGFLLLCLHTFSGEGLGLLTDSRGRHSLDTGERGIVGSRETEGLCLLVAEMYRMQAVVSKERKGGEDQEEEE